MKEFLEKLPSGVRTQVESMVREKKLNTPEALETHLKKMVNNAYAQIKNPIPEKQIKKGTPEWRVKNLIKDKKENSKEKVREYNAALAAVQRTIKEHRK